MDINELLERKAKLEEELRTYVGAAVEAFKKDTGISLRDVTVKMTNVNAWSSRKEHYVVAAVQAELALS